MTPKVPSYYTHKSYRYEDCPRQSAAVNYLTEGKPRVVTESVWPRRKPARLSLRKPLNVLPRPSRKRKFMGPDRVYRPMSSRRVAHSAILA